MGMEVSQHENMDEQDPGMGMGSGELAGMPTGEEAYTEGHDPQVRAWHRRSFWLLGGTEIVGSWLGQFLDRCSVHCCTH